MGELTVKKVLLDLGSSVNDLFYYTFKKMQLSDKALQPSGGELAGFSGERVPISCYVWLRTTLEKFPNSKTLYIQFLDNTIATVHADHKEARQCYNASLKKITKEAILIIHLVYNSESIPTLAEIDPRDNNSRPSPMDDLEKKRNLSTERRNAAAIETQKLLDAGFIQEIRFSSWLANVVMVRKSSGKWRMYVDFIDLNKACPKDLYPFPNIDRLVDDTSGYQVLSFMDAYSGYNQIQMHPDDEDKTAFVTD
ncbi:uncharacterized protein [Arachis hypogaea]|uniref:uncharacterized protein n=1 Tax=Arachis hypogaea TaxID=3818 RepID=UPI003B20DFA8